MLFMTIIPLSLYIITVKSEESYTDDATGGIFWASRPPSSSGGTNLESSYDSAALL
jgi:hypothetical protein